MWIIETESAYRAMHNCILGCGKTENEAWEDAYGMDAKQAKRKHGRKAWAKEISEEEFEERSYNA